VGYGRLIAAGEHSLNHGRWRRTKGAVMAVVLIAAVYVVVAALLGVLTPWPIATTAVEAIAIFYCLAGRTLEREGLAVFEAADRSLDEGRRQVARIVGRDTANLSDMEVRTASLETMAENLSDGVIAPLFWLALLGVPGMMAYKMVNTLDSMIGYRTERYRRFGTWAARIDDIANYIPARLTSLLMLLVAGRLDGLKSVARYGRAHLSPNSGYPEAALAAILNCRFGGPHDYFGVTVDKPFIGDNAREVTTADARRAVGVNRRSEAVMIVLVAASMFLI
jgi:adenosylcobinamide-phosphate synthase